MSQAAVLNPHVLCFGGIHPPPSFSITKDGLRGISVHMDLEDVAQDRYYSRAAKRLHRGTNLVGRREGITPNQYLGAILKVSLRAHIGSGGRGLHIALELR
jgi:hypothetical protein